MSDGVSKKVRQGAVEVDFEKCALLVNFEFETVSISIAFHGQRSTLPLQMLICLFNTNILLFIYFNHILFITNTSHYWKTIG